MGLIIKSIFNQKYFQYNLYPIVMSYSFIFKTELVWIFWNQASSYKLCLPFSLSMSFKISEIIFCFKIIMFSMTVFSVLFTNIFPCPGQCCSVVSTWPERWRIMGSIPGQGHGPGLWFNPSLSHGSSIFLSFSLFSCFSSSSFPFILSKNQWKTYTGEGFKKYTFLDNLVHWKFILITGICEL